MDPALMIVPQSSPGARPSALADAPKGWQALLPPAEAADGALMPDLAGPADLQGPTAADPAQRQADVEAKAPRHVGDAILSAINHLHGDLSASWKSVQFGRVKAPRVDVTPSDLLAMQGHLLMFSFQSEVVAKGTGKFIDNVNQTVKMS